MKKVTSTLTLLFLCLYLSAQVGSLDGGFNNPAGYVISNVLSAFPTNSDTGFAISTHSNDGRIVVANYTTRENFTLVRYTNLGALDNSFGASGVVNLRLNSGDNAVPYAVKVLPDNKILVAGWTWGSNKDFCLLKLLENGTPDLSFGSNGWVVTDFGSGHDEARSMAVQSDGKIVLAGIAYNGNNYDFAVARYTLSGSLDLAGFGGGTGKVTTPIAGNDIAKSVAIQSADQKIVVGGTKDVNGTNPNYMFVRYNTDGSLDATPGNFGTGGIVDLDLGNGGAGSIDVGFSLAIQSDGFIVMTGMSKAVSASNNDVATVRLTTSGGLDPAFNPTGAIVGRASSTTAAGIAIFNNSATTNTDEGVRTIALQSNGDILVAGDTDGEGSTFALLLLRYNSNGELDTDFSGDGKATADLSTTDDEFGYGMALFSNRIYVSGATGAPSDLLLIAFQNDGSPLPLVLSQFYAQKQTSKVVLQWTTTSEEDVKQFVIERSNDGKTYKAIGTVAATGNSNTKKKNSDLEAMPGI